MKLELEFKSVAKDGLPEKSGACIVVCHGEDYTFPYITNFSAVHKKFNAYDNYYNNSVDEAFIERTCLKDVVAYCELSEEDIEKIVQEAGNDGERDSGKD